MWHVPGAHFVFESELEAQLSTPQDSSWATAHAIGTVLRGPTPNDAEFQYPVSLGEAPAVPNVYTDGSVKRPGYRELSIGGFSVVLDAPIPHDQLPLYSEFIECVMLDPLDSRTKRAPIKGVPISSTRAEITAIAVSSLIPQPLHIGTDSLVAVNNFAKCKARVLAHLARGTESACIFNGRWANPFWVNKSDGDIYSILEHALTQRGCASMRLRKVPAHQDFSAIAEGKISEADWFGNHLADAAASQAATEVPCTGALAARTLKRASMLASVVRAVQDMLVQVLQADSSARGAQSRVMACRQPQSRAVLINHPTAGEARSIRRFSAVFSRPVHPTWQQSLSEFIIQHEWIPVPDRGLPMVLLLIILEVHLKVSVFPSAFTNASPLAIRPSIKQKLHALVLATREAAKGVHPEDRCTLCIKSSGTHALAHIGLFGYTPLLAAWPILSEAIWREVSETALTLRKKLPPGWREAYRQGNLALGRQQLNLQGTPGWGSPPLPQCVGAGGQVLTGAVYLLRCIAPGCKGEFPLPAKPFRSGSSWPKVKCPKCKQIFRCGLARCALCLELVKHCECSLVPQSGIRANRQTTLAF